MDDDFLNCKYEIEKINQRIKEYLWKKQNLLYSRKKQQKNARCQFLAK